MKKKGLLLLFASLVLWPPLAGAGVLFFINGLGDLGAFNDLPSDAAFRSLRLAAIEGFLFGLRTMPFLSLGPACIVFAARRWATRMNDFTATAIGGFVMSALFVARIIIEPLDPIVAGIIPLVVVVLLISSAISGFLVASLRPRANQLTQPQ